jgi:hypothetical protein
MINFYQFLNLLNESLEKDLFEPHPDSSSPEGGSSHSIYRLRDKKGEDFWSKSAASNLQTINEYLAWNIYKLFEISVSSNAYLVVDNNNKLRMVSSQVSGKQVPLSYGSKLSNYLSGSDIHKGFFVDAFLGHWDVVGNAPRSNLFIDDEKRVARIDLGGMDFRATGPRKSKTIPGSWGSEVGELQTMGGLGGPSMKSNASDVFGNLSKEQLLESARVFSRISWQQIENIIKKVLSEVIEISNEHNLPRIKEETIEYLNDLEDVLYSRYQDVHKKIKQFQLDQFSEVLILSGVKVFLEEISTYDQIEDKEMLYKTYYDTYEDANMKDGKGLKPWNRNDFEWRAEKWTFAGILPKEGVPYEQLGFVTARLKSGVYKLTGMQGPNTKGKIKGLMELVGLGKPIWGAMDKDFTQRLKKLGFSSPPLKIMKMLLPMIQSDPQFSSGGSWGDLSADGGINFELSGIGHTVKYFTANKQFYQLLIDKAISKGKIDSKMIDLLKKWPSMPKNMKQMALMFLPKNIDLDVESLDWLADILN